MRTQTRVLAIVPARAGSKSVPRKNVAEVAGRPLIAYAIAAAQSARGIERLIVSTDDPGVADVARRWGAEVPFLRPPDLARDDTPGIAPVRHALRWLDEHEGYRPDYAMLLQPTSPLRAAEDIEAAIRLAAEHDADAVISVCPVEHHPYWAMKLSPEGTVANFLGQSLDEVDRRYPRRQDLPPAYAENGAIYLTRRSVLLDGRSLYGARTFGYAMPAERSLDINTPWDFYLAGLILEARGTR